MRRKFLSVVLCVCMMMTMVPFAFAAEGTKGTESNPYSLSEFNALTRDQYKTAQEALGGTMYVNVGKYSYGQNGALGNGIRNDTTGQVPDHSKLNAYGENGYLGEKNDGANGKNVVFVGTSITSGATGYTSIDNIGTSLLLAVPAYTNVTFKDITFNNVFSFDYQLYTSPWSQLGSLNFEGCTFNGIIVGGIASQALKFDGCTFNDYTNATSANNSNPTWIRPAYGNWTKGDNEGQGNDFRSLTNITFTNNKVTSTRPVKFEYIAQWEMPTTVTATGNTFDIKRQEKDTSTKNIGMYLGAHTDSCKFTLIADDNTKSENTAALYTVPEGKQSLPEGSTVKNSRGEKVTLTDALAWKSNTPIELKSSYDPSAVALVNDTTYSTLAGAVEAANGKTITLLKDTTESVIIPVGKTVTLDLNGNNVTTSTGCAIVNKGALTIVGDGNVSATQSDMAAIANFPDAVANLNGGTYTSAEWYVIKNMGQMTIDGAVSVKKPDGSTNTASLIDNGWASSIDTVAGESVQAQANKATLTIKNGAFEGKSGSDSCSVVKNDDYGTLKITGGTFDSTPNNNTSNAATILNWNIAEISGGTFIGRYPIANGAYTGNADKGQLTISGGDFTGINSLFGYGEGGNGTGKLVITGGKFKAPQFGYIGNAYTVEISNGYFTIDPSAYCAEGKTGIPSTEPGYAFTVGEKATSTVVKPATGAPDVEIPASIKEEDKGTVTRIGESVADSSGVLSTAANQLTTQVESQADAAKTAYKDSSISGASTTEDSNIHIYAQTYLSVTPTAYSEDKGSLTLDIQPMYRVVASTVDLSQPNTELKTEGADQNAVILSNSAKPLNIQTMTISIALPTGFVNNTTTPVYVQHKGYEYTATVTQDSANTNAYIATFTNPHGFSEFTISTTSQTVANIGDTNYTSLQDAVNAANDGDTITVTKNDNNLSASMSGSSKTIKVKNGTDTEIKVTINGTEKTIDADKTETFTYTRPSHSSSGSTSTTYAVNVNAATNGAVAADKKTAAKGTTVTVTATPSAGYVVDAVKVVDKDGKDVAVTEKDGKYVFTMPASAVTVTGTFKAEAPAPSGLPFVDVKSGDWFYDAVKYAYENGLMNGTSATTFAPNGTMNRAMIVTVLYRLEKSPAVTTAAKFTDVPAGQWYSDAVAWAAANNIVNGYDETTFGPLNAVTREQMAAILYRYEQYKGMDTVTLEENLNRFPDQDKISAYAVPALQWAVGQKIINGNADGTLDPTGTATRAQVAQIFMNLLNK